jgi:hypothetical protein
MKRASVAILAIIAVFFAIACSVLTRNESPSVSGATEDQSPTQTVAATPVSTHRPISPASVTSTHILEDFPLGVGTTWVYSATFISGWWFGEDLDDAEFMEIRHTGLITETIVGKNHAGNTMVFTAALSGILTETCHGRIIRPF